MTRTNWLKSITLASTLIFSLLSYPENVQSQSLELARNHLLVKQLNFVPPVPPDPGEPGGRAQGGGSRGSCQKYQSLKALVPVTERANKKFVWGSTVAAHPTFWFYIPDKLTTGVSLEFVLQDEADNFIYTKTITPSDLPSGVISLSVPTTAPSLQVGKLYRWTFSIGCDPAKPSAAVFVRGSIQRIQLNSSLQRQLEAAKTPLERAAFYATNGIWYETLTTLGEQLRSNPKETSISAAWVDLLQQVDLGSLAQAPIVD